ncbi:MAG: ATP-binding protein [Myxococcales bacterium]|nr:ATP-binding protein [Myxococcales bacterium]
MSNIDHVVDYIDLFAASLQLRIESDPARAAELGAGIAASRTKLDLAREGGESPAAAVIARLALSETEQLVVWLLIALALRRDLRAMMAAATGENGSDPTLEAIRLVIYGGYPTPMAFTELSSEGTLRRLGILQRTDSGADVHESRQTWAVSRRVLTCVLGDAGPDPRFAGIAIERPVTARTALAIPASCVEATDRALATERTVIVIEGTPGSGRRTLLTACSARPEAILVIDVRRLAADAAGFHEELRAIALECRIHGKTPLLCNLEALVDDQCVRLGQLVRELGALVDRTILVTCRTRPSVDWGRPVVVIELQPPTHAQRIALWQFALAALGDHDANYLAQTYPLAPAFVMRAAAAALAAAGGQALQRDDICGGIRAVLDDQLGAYAKRITVSQTWNDVVLPPEQIEAIIELMSRVRGRHEVYETWGFAAKVGRGLGVSALFSGPPGTGKTMVAGLIAQELALELYQVDMAKLTSKYIGETEKHLAALFDAAEAGHAILLFDEADSLFGKRTEVKSSNDRYANLETNYLLQRLESFTGICLLTSNHETNMDPAFQRRLSLHLRFELPDVEERAQMWRAVLPASAPTASDIDFTALAQKYTMSGGYIRNAVLRAAFLASDRKETITTALLERAARVEYEGMGKIAA